MFGHLVVLRIPSLHIPRRQIVQAGAMSIVLPAGAHAEGRPRSVAASDSAGAAE